MSLFDEVPRQWFVALKEYVSTYDPLWEGCIRGATEQQMGAIESLMGVAISSDHRTFLGYMGGDDGGLLSSTQLYCRANDVIEFLEEERRLEPQIQRLDHVLFAYGVGIEEVVLRREVTTNVPEVWVASSGEYVMPLAQRFDCFLFQHAFYSGELRRWECAMAVDGKRPVSLNLMAAARSVQEQMQALDMATMHDVQAVLERVCESEGLTCCWWSDPFSLSWVSGDVSLCLRFRSLPDAVSAGITGTIWGSSLERVRALQQSLLSAFPAFE